MHFVAAALMALGTLSSSFWILATNSWMQTPVGYEVIDGKFFPKDWLEIIFSPSFPYRLTHTVSAFYVTTAFVVLSVGAYTVRRGQWMAEGRMMLRLALWFLAIFVRRKSSSVTCTASTRSSISRRSSPRSRVSGTAAAGSPASVIGWPDETKERNLAEIAIPRLGSLYLTHSWDGQVKGLKDFPHDQRAPVAIVYFAFRIMVGIATLMLAVVVTGFVLMMRGQLDQTRRNLRLCQMATCLDLSR